ncbi:2871_t:CDS:2, partial [Gigaspora rosea]
KIISESIKQENVKPRLPRISIVNVGPSCWMNNSRIVSSIRIASDMNLGHSDSKKKAAIVADTSTKDACGKDVFL